MWREGLSVRGRTGCIPRAAGLGYVIDCVAGSSSGPPPWVCELLFLCEVTVTGVSVLLSSCKVLVSAAFWELLRELYDRPHMQVLLSLGSSRLPLEDLSLHVLNLGVGGGSGAPLTLGATRTDRDVPHTVVSLALRFSHLPPKPPQPEHTHMGCAGRPHVLVAFLTSHFVSQLCTVCSPAQTIFLFRSVYLFSYP